MRPTPLVLTLTLLLSAPLLPACSLFSNGSHNATANLITAPNPPIADVPVPAGFAIMKAQSTSKVIPSSNVRFVDHRYSGPDDYLPVVRFYRDQLPTLGWTLADQTQSRSEFSLHFTKNSEDCFITITAGSLHSNTHIRIRIDPIGRNTPK